MIDIDTYMTFVHYTSFYYTNLITFPKISTKFDILYLSISKTESISIHYYFIFNTKLILTSEKKINPTFSE
jgi:hypothetical protein